ncbi:MAG: DUF1638 domain-containing protein [Acidimicrobiales bacterium]
MFDHLGLTSEVDVHYLPAKWHNRPEHIVPELTSLLTDTAERPVFVAYADCGTGGGLDRLLADHPGVERLPGAHCYEMFAGSERFAALHDAEPGTLYLTDYLARHFEALVWTGLGLNRHPELLSTYFANYTRVVLLSQHDDGAVLAAAEAAADRLGLPLVHQHVGHQHLADALPVTIRSGGLT